MARLEDLTADTVVKGIVGDDPVTIVAASWYGNAVLEVTYKTDKGQLGSELLYRDSEPDLKIIKDSLPWSFDADGGLMRLVSEAYRIHLAHLFDPYLAVHTSEIEPLPHQISAVYKEMLPRMPLRYVLADDPGSGKTIMTGLLLKELIIRGDVKRCLIVTPGNLSEQWQDELYRKFHLRFKILNNDNIDSAVTGNVFEEMPFCIARLDKLARNDDLQRKLKAIDWDIIVCDEAHKMSATVFGGEVKYTKRFRLGQLLSTITRHFLLLTATPHNGKEEDFQLFMSLIDPDRFEGKLRSRQQSIDVSDVMRRLVKEELLKFDGTPLFPERLAYTVNYDLSPNEAQLYEAVTEYVQEEFNRADKLNTERRNTVGFALTILQRRLASSPEAIYQSLRRRRERLEQRVTEEKMQRHVSQDSLALKNDDDFYDLDEMPGEEFESVEDRIADQASASSTIKEMEAEIETLKHLEQAATEVRATGDDRKWEELSKLLQEDKNMFSPDGRREKLIIFTEHKDTLYYLTNKIRSLLGNDHAVVTIHGGMQRRDRHHVEELFKQDKEVRILIATDAAGEGINLQRAHLMINYDLPWNPNRLEQRFGRIHRIGQTEVCHFWNLVSNKTREGQVYQKLLAKLDNERKALGGKVFDILGKVKFENKSLRQLLIEAVRYGNRPEVKARLDQVVDHSLDQKALKNLLKERALTEDTMDIHQVSEIREDMERVEAHKLQPHFIEAFFKEAFTKLGGSIKPREQGRYEITSVPYTIRHFNESTLDEPILRKYERVCFDKTSCHLHGKATAVLLCPGQPLLDAAIGLILERYGDVLKRGTIYVDENDENIDPRLLFYIEDAIQDGKILDNGTRRVISKHVHFVELKENGTSMNAGYAPYLDYRPANEEERKRINGYIKNQSWLMHNVEERAKRYAIEQIIPDHFQTVKSHKVKLIEKTMKAVKERLTAEIQYWDYQAADLKEKEATGKTNAKLNSKLATRRAEELEGRMRKRLAELEQTKHLSPMPPKVVGGSLVVPLGLLTKLFGKPSTAGLFGKDRRTIELAGMRAVMMIERELGFVPEDVSMKKCGYDIESIIPEAQRHGGSCLRFIEVKGRTSDATTVTLSKNEILTALNKPDEFILALVKVDGVKTHTIYLKKPFIKAPDFSATSVNYDIMKLIDHAKVLLEK
ncbi:helicase-related protein [Sporolactobacillus sp. THM19-2]|uniref:helicase-related protein n=1 Tax=Sporolactobacillus sp. THM19-2 TaxID=2511171 RepID=UPI00101F8578|nr:helicase-related protein [Sporolactobacillus sp. THM19-2]RYL92591.1 DUF3883 domain-containing protein [Sporolactobacillus sp. THM19-2]